MAGRGEQESDYGIPTNNYSGALAASIIVGGHLLVYGFTVFSTNGAAQFALLFDAQTVPGDGAVPIFALDLPSAELRGVSYTPQGREFLAGFVLCNSSTSASKTIGAADCFFDVQYDVLG